MASQEYEIQVEEYGPNGDEEDCLWGVQQKGKTVFVTDVYEEAESWIATQHDSATSTVEGPLVGPVAWR